MASFVEKKGHYGKTDNGYQMTVIEYGLKIFLITIWFTDCICSSPTIKQILISVHQDLKLDCMNS